MKKVIAGILLTCCSSTVFGAQTELWSLKCGIAEPLVMISAPEREYALLGIEKDEDAARGKGMYTEVNGVTNGGLSYDVFAHVILKNGKAPYGQDTLLVRADDSFTIATLILARL